MAFPPRGLVVHKRVARMHHGQVVEEDHVAGPQRDFDGVLHGQSVQGVEREALGWGQGRQGRRSGRRGRSGDAGAGEVDEDAAGEMVGEGDGAGIEGLGGRRALERSKTLALRSAMAADWSARKKRFVFWLMPLEECPVPDHRPIAAESVRKFRSERRELLVYGG